MKKVKMNLRVNLIGLKKNFWEKNMAGWFSIGGRELTNVEAHKMIDYALEKGIEYSCDVPAEEIKKHLGWED